MSSEVAYPSSAKSNISRPILSSSPRHKTLAARIALRLIHWFRPPVERRAGDDSEQRVTVTCIADTHNMRPVVPFDDILLHAGDLSQYGTFDEIQAQLDWLNTQPHRHKIVIAANHDLLLDEAFVRAHPDRELDEPGKSARDLDWGDIVYLEDSGVSLWVDYEPRPLKIWGSPCTPRCGNFAFQYNPSEAQDVWKKIPEGTEILLTHGPPAMQLDEGKGCEFLLKAIWRIRPHTVIFGHIHGARGKQRVEFCVSQKLYESIGLGKWPWVNLVVLLFVPLWARALRALGFPGHVDQVLYHNAACHEDDALEI